MDSFYDRLINRAATIDDLLSDDFERLPGETDQAGIGQRRLAEIQFAQGAQSRERLRAHIAGFCRLEIQLFDKGIRGGSQPREATVELDIEAAAIDRFTEQLRSLSLKVGARVTLSCAA